MVKRLPILLLALTLALVALLLVPAHGKSARVFDYAGVMSAGEAAELDEYLARLRAETGYDFVFLADTELEYRDCLLYTSKKCIFHALILHLSAAARIIYL